MDEAVSNLWNVIAVRPPYFALEGLRFDGEDSVTAQVRPEQPKGREVGPGAAAEVGRHLAILGSCAVGLQQSHAHYFLARRATLTWLPQTPMDFARAVVLGVHAKGQWLNRRETEARAVLRSPEGMPLYQLDVGYAALRDSVFKRINREYVLDTAPEQVGASPYAAPLPLGKHRYRDRAVTVEVPPLQLEQCAGHFPQVPALPVAILMYYLSTAAGNLLAAMRNADVPYLVRQADVRADNLAFAGRSLRLEVVLLDAGRDHSMYDCMAVDSADRVVGEMRLSLQHVY